MKLSELKKICSEMSIDDFAARYPHPFLRMDDVYDAPLERSFETVAVSNAQRSQAASETSAESVIFPIVREGSDKSQPIPVGRAGNMNIVLNNPAISKMHAYFQWQVFEERWILADAGSSNGTSINGTRLDPKTPAPIEDGDAIDFAGAMSGTFLSARSLYDEVVD